MAMSQHDKFYETAKDMALDARFAAQVSGNVDAIDAALDNRCPFAGHEDFWWAFTLGWLYANNVKIPDTERHYDRFVQHELL
jgi:hypothetical protein